MRKTIVLCAILLALTAAPIVAEERVFSIVVTGEALVMAVPDEAVITLSIQTNREQTRARARAFLNDYATRLVDYLRDSGVPDKMFKTTQRRVTPVYKHENGQSRRTGYMGYQTFQVVLPLADADELLDGMPDVVDENGVVFRVSNARDIRDQAIDQAIDDASDRAQRRAEKLGIELGPIIGFSESNLGQALNQRGRAQPMMMEASAAKVQLPAGENELRVNVSITYQIEVPQIEVPQ